MSDTTSVDEGIAPTARIPDDPQATWPSLRPINAKLPLRSYFSEIWARRHFALAVPFGDLRARHQDTLFGQLWHLINPLLLTGVYWLVFGTIIGREVDDLPYLPFLIAGVIPFQFTQKSVTQGARLIHSNRRLIQSIHFPRAILPLSAVLGEFIAHASALGIMFLVVLIYDLVSSGLDVIAWTWLLIVPITLLQALLNLGIALVASRLTFHFRDIQNMLPYLLRLLFYMSGIIFSVEQVTEGYPRLRTILHANPINGIVRLSRDAMLRGTTDPSLWWLVAGWTAGLILAGFFFFRAAETEYGRV